MIEIISLCANQEKKGGILVPRSSYNLSWITTLLLYVHIFRDKMGIPSEIGEKIMYVYSL